jgi:hypothetical protein
LPVASVPTIFATLYEGCVDLHLDFIKSSAP